MWYTFLGFLALADFADTMLCVDIQKSELRRLHEVSESKSYMIHPWNSN